MLLKLSSKKLLFMGAMVLPVSIIAFVVVVSNDGDAVDGVPCACE